MEFDLKERLFSLQTVFSLGVVALAAGVLYYTVDLQAAWSVLQRTDPWLYCAALLLFYIPFLFRGGRWKSLLSEAGFDVSLTESTEIVFLSFFMNNIVPAQLGDVYRGHLFGSRKGVSRSKVIGTVFVSRVFDLTALVGGTTLVSFLLLHKNIATMARYLEIGYGAIAVVLLGTLFLVYEKGVNVLPSRLADAVRQFREGAVQCLSRSNVAAVLGYTVLIWLFVAARLVVVAAALDLNFSFLLSTFVALFMILVTVIPLTPAGLGAVEVLTTGSLAVLGVSASDALALVLLDRTIHYISLLFVGGIVYTATKKQVI